MSDVLTAPAPSKPESTKRRKRAVPAKGNGKPKAKKTLSEADQLKARERELRKKYKRIVVGSIRRETKGTHKNKLTVEITCAVRGCNETRRVATSDLFQVKYCEAHTEEFRKKRRAERAKANRAAKKKSK